MIIGVTALGAMFVVGTRMSYILIAELLVAPIGWKVFITGESWHMRRLPAFLSPYQLYESLISIGRGPYGEPRRHPALHSRTRTSAIRSPRIGVTPA